MDGYSCVGNHQGNVENQVVLPIVWMTATYSVLYSRICRAMSTPCLHNQCAVTTYRNMVLHFVQVKLADAVRGNGAFAVTNISKGTYICSYEGTLLSEAEFWKRYPKGQAEYCIDLHNGWLIDAVDRAKDTQTFSACHMNHSSLRHNVARRTDRAQKRVEFYAERDIGQREELLLDYGKQYWKGRESQELP